METTPEWQLTEDQTIRRKDLHDRFGGNRQRGIATTASNIMLFSEGGDEHGYADYPDGEHFYVYTGEGRTGDQTMTRGNAAILKHGEEGRPLRLFSGARGVVTYLGEYEYYEHSWDRAQDSSGIDRRVLRFRLRKT